MTISVVLSMVRSFALPFDSNSGAAKRFPPELSGSEPDMSNLAAVARQVFEAVKAFKTLEGDVGHIAGFGEAQIDRYSGAAIFVRLERHARKPDCRRPGRN